MGFNMNPDLFGSKSSQALTLLNVEVSKGGQVTIPYTGSL
jgi:hypothetical protein